MTNPISLGIDPTTDMLVVNLTLTAIEAKLQYLGKMSSDQWSVNDLLDYSQLMIYQDLLTTAALS